MRSIIDGKEDPLKSNTCNDVGHATYLTKYQIDKKKTWTKVRNDFNMVTMWITSTY